MSMHSLNALCFFLSRAFKVVCLLINFSNTRRHLSKSLKLKLAFVAMSRFHDRDNLTNKNVWGTIPRSQIDQAE